jgi:chromosome segregation ATPase
MRLYQLPLTSSTDALVEAEPRASCAKIANGEICVDRFDPMAISNMHSWHYAAESILSRYDKLAESIERYRSAITKLQNSKKQLEEMLAKINATILRREGVIKNLGIAIAQLQPRIACSPNREALNQILSDYKAAQDLQIQIVEQARPAKAKAVAAIVATNKIIKEQEAALIAAARAAGFANVIPASSLV